MKSMQKHKKYNLHLDVLDLLCSALTPEYSIN